MAQTHSKMFIVTTDENGSPVVLDRLNNARAQLEDATGDTTYYYYEYGYGYESKKEVPATWEGLALSAAVTIPAIADAAHLITDLWVGADAVTTTVGATATSVIGYCIVWHGDGVYLSFPLPATGQLDGYLHCGKKKNVTIALYGVHGHGNVGYYTRNT